MTASRAARERKAASEAGPLARVKIDLDAQKQFVYKISCTECVAKGDRSWSAYRPGGDNGFLAAMDRGCSAAPARAAGAAARRAMRTGFAQNRGGPAGPRASLEG